MTDHATYMRMLEAEAGYLRERRHELAAALTDARRDTRKAEAEVERLASELATAVGTVDILSDPDTMAALAQAEFDAARERMTNQLTDTPPTTTNRPVTAEMVRTAMERSLGRLFGDVADALNDLLGQTEADT